MAVQCSLSLTVALKLPGDSPISLPSTHPRSRLCQNCSFGNLVSGLYSGGTFLFMLVLFLYFIFTYVTSQSRWQHEISMPYINFFSKTKRNNYIVISPSDICCFFFLFFFRCIDFIFYFFLILFYF